ncbi:hypothetical protein [Mangrovibacterium sp.]|uniref:hypothetical protein n=1 Tax=Mangrovibacterium sp. TaxID=1961364 RepID=UPI0035669876
MKWKKQAIVSRSIVLLFLICVFPHFSSAQDQLPLHLKQCSNHTNEAWRYGQETANILEFNNGASDLEMIREYCFQALSAMDSIGVKLQQAVYSADDATFAAKNQDLAAIAKAAIECKSELQSAMSSLNESKKYLRIVLDEVDTTAINELFFHTMEHLNDSRQLIRQVQRKLNNTSKSLTK